jgi:hypothetical protein
MCIFMPCSTRVLQKLTYNYSSMDYAPMGQNYMGSATQLQCQVLKGHRSTVHRAMFAWIEVQS